MTWPEFLAQIKESQTQLSSAVGNAFESVGKRCEDNAISLAELHEEVKALRAAMHEQCHRLNVLEGATNRPLLSNDRPTTTTKIIKEMDIRDLQMFAERVSALVESIFLDGSSISEIRRYATDVRPTLGRAHLSIAHLVECIKGNR